MSGILRFDSKREMDMMAALLLGKGKKIEPMGKRGRGHLGNRIAGPKWEIRVTPAIRWSSQSTYRQQLMEYDSAVGVINGIVGVDPTYMGTVQIQTLCDAHWVCACNLIRPVAHDRCFKCDGAVGLAPSRYPDQHEMKGHLIQKYEDEVNAS